MKIYQDRIEEFKKRSIKLADELSQLSLNRVIAFVLSFVIITFLANARAVGLIVVLTPIGLYIFARLVKRYNELSDLNRHTTFLKKINESEVLRLRNNLSDLPSGKEFMSLDHPYISDLDIFGPHSLFQLIN